MICLRTSHNCSRNTRTSNNLVLEYLVVLNNRQLGLGGLIFVSVHVLYFQKHSLYTLQSQLVCLAGCAKTIEWQHRLENRYSSTSCTTGCAVFAGQQYCRVRTLLCNQCGGSRLGRTTREWQRLPDAQGPLMGILLLWPCTL